ncbi:MAG: undecaprenyl-diphosphate phosphatase [Chitinophagaceae bacterium]|nr:MAG: undecaprenyl-diphosphate phosphatase [Chitinophagaceae bacterium]
MDIVQTIIIGIVEGITEFLPISSTGHMIITEKLLQIPEDDFSKLFTIAIQLGAILAVVVLYWKKFFAFKHWEFYVKLIIAVIPAIVLGLLFNKKIDALLDKSMPIAITMLAGGIVLLFVDRLFKTPKIDREEDIPFAKAFLIGIWQCIAMITGVSRSAASIIGGMQQKLTRSAAAEFSFFLAVPTMLAATGYKLLKYYNEHGGINAGEIKTLAIGNLVAFVVAMLAIKFFIGFLKKHGFAIWGWYRIVLGSLLLILIFTGYIHA